MRVDRALVAALASAALNLNFLAELLMPRPLPLGRSAVSEMSAVGRPWAWGFRLADLLTGLLVVVVASAWLGASGRTTTRTRWVRAVGGCAALFALCTAVAALVPLPCAPSVSAGCTTTTAQGLVHDAFSVVGTTSAVVGSVLTAWLGRRRRWLLVLVAAGVGGLAVVQSVAYATVSASADLGWVQRGQIAAVSAWILTLAAVGPDREPARRPPLPSAPAPPGCAREAAVLADPGAEHRPGG